jgi:hypothetical protein
MRTVADYIKRDKDAVGSREIDGSAPTESRSGMPNNMGGSRAAWLKNQWDRGV